VIFNRFKWYSFWHYAQFRVLYGLLLNVHTKGYINMASYSTNEFRGGLKLMLDGDPCSIIENELVKPGKGQAFNRVKLRNLKTGRVLERTFKSGESVESADVIDVDMEFSYNDGEFWYFMDPNTFEQMAAPDSALVESGKWIKAQELWSDYVSDKDAVFDQEIRLDGKTISPQVTWGTSPEMVIPIDGEIPDPQTQSDETRREGWARALEYMGLESGTPISEVKVDKVFIGSCTNGRIEDLRVAAQVARGHRVASNVSLAMVVPGSGLVKRQAEAEGLDAVFTRAGFEWREPGCSMCLAMNADRLEIGERCASTSNRNFEGRQGHGGRTHLVSPALAAAAAVAGHFIDPADLEDKS